MHQIATSSRTGAIVRTGRVVLGHLPAGVGQFRVADRVYEHALAQVPRGSLVRTRLQNGAVVDLDVSDYVEARVAMVRHWQPAVVRVLAESLASGGVFFDVGAHVGLVSLAVAAAAPGRAPRIHAFEPLPANAERLRHNVALNAGADVAVNAVAVGAAPGSVAVETPDPRVPSMGHVREGDADAPGTVPMITLDDYARDHGIERVDALKIDVEGYEQPVLEGARELLGGRRIGAIVCELNEEELRKRGSSSQTLVDLLAAHGYDHHPLPNVGARRWTHGRLGAAFEDAVFTPG